MVMENPGVGPAAAHAANGLRRYQGLKVQLTALLFLLVLIFAGASTLISKLLINSHVQATAPDHESISGDQLAVRFNTVAEHAQTLALSLAAGGSSDSVPQLADLQPDSELIDSIGIWPAQERTSQLWLRDAQGKFQPHSEYNDPNTASYIHEKWYTPARYMPGKLCYWTPAYHDALSHHAVITCSVSIQNARGNAGVATVSLGVDALEAAFIKASKTETGYSLLLDEDNRILALSSAASKVSAKEKPRNLAEFSQMQASLKPVSIVLNQEPNKVHDQNSVTQIAALRAETRDMSSSEAIAVLTQVATAQQRGSAEPRQLHIDDDPIIDGSANATVFSLSGAQWHLLSVTPVASSPIGRATYTALLIGIATLILVFALGYFSLRGMVITPLRRLAERIDKSVSTESPANGHPLHNEIGVVAQQVDDLLGQMRDLATRSVTASTQLVAESEERRKSRETLDRLQERVSLALQSVSDGIITTDALGRVDDMNPVAEQLTGQSLRSAYGKPFNEVFTAHGKKDVAVPNLATMVIQRGAPLTYSDGMRLMSFNRQIHHVQLSVTPVRTRQNRISGTVAVFKRSEAQNSGRAEESSTRKIHAGMTMESVLDNRLQSLVNASRGARSHALLLIDTDHLKNINDTGGTEAGDAAITHIGETIGQRIGIVGDIFKISGARYVVLLENHDTERALVLSELLRATIASTPFEWESRTHAMTVCIGAVVFDSRMVNPASIIQHAEVACGVAKREGRNRVILWNKEVHKKFETVDDEVWIRRIRTGLDKNLLHLTTQQIQPSPQYQAEGRVYEVLVALEDEEGFWSNASSFLPVAERLQLMPELDCWVISNTISYLEKNAGQISSVGTVSINLAASSLASPLVLEHIVKAFEEHPTVAPHLICFEITEETATNYMQQAQIFSTAMHGIGCRLSVDHFSGRHISDINLLRRLPLDFVKVDSQEFRNIATDTVEKTIAESLIRLARTMQKRIIVANLENNANLQAWQQLGADYFQGHIISKPTPAIFAVQDAIRA